MASSATMAKHDRDENKKRAGSGRDQDDERFLVGIGRGRERIRGEYRQADQFAHGLVGGICCGERFTDKQAAERKGNLGGGSFKSC